MRVLLVIPTINPISGGPTRSCKGLCRALSSAGFDVTLLVLGGRHTFENPCGVKVLYLKDAVQPNVSTFDLVHLQGLWNLGLHTVASACRKTKVPYVISPRGMLDPWALSVKKWKKRLGMFLYQREDLKHAAAFHATAELEASNIRAQGLRQPIFVVPNGVEAPVGEFGQRECVKRGAGNAGSRVALFLGRLHPGKGLLTLAEAWARVRPQGWVMRVVGPDSYGHKTEVVSKLDVLGILEQWQFVDMVDDIRKWKEYSEADILVHPSVSENFGITIAEGLYAGLPVICTKGAPWHDIEEFHCGKWIEIGVDPLVGALSELLGLPTTQLHAMGANGHALITDKYLWPAIAQKMIKGYEEVLNA